MPATSVFRTMCLAFCYLKTESLKCANWSLALKEEERLRLFENGVLRGIRKNKRGELTGVSRKLPSEEQRELCASVYIIRMIT